MALGRSVRKYMDDEEEQPTLLDSALDVLWSISEHIPEMWGDDIRDGYITLNISADTIHELERVLYVSEAD